MSAFHRCTQEHDAAKRSRQAELFRTWQLWRQRSGPKTLVGKAKAARNGDPGWMWAAERAEVQALRKVANDLLKQQRE